MRTRPERRYYVKLRQMFVDSLADDAMGVGIHRRGDEILFYYPVAVLVATRLSAA